MLNKQMEKVRVYDLQIAEGIGEEITAIARYVAKEGILEKPEFSDRRPRIEKLYKELGISITVQRDEVGEKIKQVRKAKKTLQAYANSS